MPKHGLALPLSLEGVEHIDDARGEQRPPVDNRGSLVDWTKLKPLLLASLPTALIGGFIILDPRICNTVTGIVLLTAAAILIFRRTGNGEPDYSTPLGGQSPQEQASALCLD